jgi:hypothetical protein
MNDNPWRGLPDKSPFVLPEDTKVVETFNKRAHRDHFLHLEFVPEPFVGKLEAL